MHLHPGLLEQGTGIEPAFTAWEAVVLPIYEPCKPLYYSRPVRKKQPLILRRFRQNPPPSILEGGGEGYQENRGFRARASWSF